MFFSEWIVSPLTGEKVYAVVQGWGFKIVRQLE